MCFSNDSACLTIFRNKYCVAVRIGRYASLLYLYVGNIVIILPTSKHFPCPLTLLLKTLPDIHCRLGPLGTQVSFWKICLNEVWSSRWACQPLCYSGLPLQNLTSLKTLELNTSNRLRQSYLALRYCWLAHTPCSFLHRPCLSESEK